MADIYPITVPKWGIEMQEGTIVCWHVAEGDAVNKGDELMDMETDKIVNTVEVPVSGILHRRLAAEDETLDVGTLLGVIAAADVNDADIDKFIADFKPADASFAFDDEGNATDTKPATTKTAPRPAEETGTGHKKPRVSLVAARLAQKLGVDISQVTGSGKDGRISAEDVEAYAKKNIGGKDSA
ncbi:MAG: biotin/lipoyl-containing protein [Gammaproteobacteria bacterium]